MIRGIKIDDFDSNVSSEVFDPKPRIYGNVDIDDKERKLLELPPKFWTAGKSKSNQLLD